MNEQTSKLDDSICEYLERYGPDRDKTGIAVRVFVEKTSEAVAAAERFFADNDVEYHLGSDVEPEMDLEFTISMQDLAERRPLEKILEEVRAGEISEDEAALLLADLENRPTIADHIPAGYLPWEDNTGYWFNVQPNFAVLAALENHEWVVKVRPMWYDAELVFDFLGIDVEDNPETTGV